MTNKLVVIINSLKVPNIKKTTIHRTTQYTEQHNTYKNTTIHRTTQNYIEQYTTHRTTQQLIEEYTIHRKTQQYIKQKPTLTIV